MKKFLSLLTSITLTTGLTISVVSCNKQTYKNVTQEQEIKALNNFLKHNESKLPSDFITNCKFTFKNNKPIKNIQKIDFTVLGTKNLTITNKTQLIGKYIGSMLYDLKNKSFNLIGKPFDNISYAPGFFNPGLGFSSTITGNADDFTIAADSLDWNSFVIWTTDGSTNTQIFDNLGWKNESVFDKVNFHDIVNLIANPFFDKGFYMALVHFIKNKTTNQYEILWDNFNNRKNLPTYGGYIKNFYWKKTITTNHLYISKSLLKTFYQLKTYNLNSFLNNKAVFFDWVNKKDNKGILITKNIKTFMNYNTSEDELWNGLNDLFTNWNTYKTKINTLLTDSKKYKAYDLVFNKNNNNWIFDKNNSKGLEQTL